MSDRPCSTSHTSQEKMTEESIEVIIQTDIQRIHGHLHLRTQKGFNGDLGDAPQFLAVTDGRVLSGSKESSLSFDELMVNRDHVVWILPLKNREVES